MSPTTEPGSVPAWVSEWLRYRIWELTEGKLTVAVRVAELDGRRLLVLSAHEAIEPIRYKGRIRRRVDDNCVDVDPTTWYNRRLHTLGHDWSAQPSGHKLSDISPIAVEIARRYLRRSARPDTSYLADTNDEDLIRRLNLVDGSDRLTNAGSLLFIDTPTCAASPWSTQGDSSLGWLTAGCSPAAGLNGSDAVSTTSPANPTQTEPDGPVM